MKWFLYYMGLLMLVLSGCASRKERTGTARRTDTYSFDSRQVSDSSRTSRLWNWKQEEVCIREFSLSVPDDNGKQYVEKVTWYDRRGEVVDSSETKSRSVVSEDRIVQRNEEVKSEERSRTDSSSGSWRWIVGMVLVISVLGYLSRRN